MILLNPAINHPINGDHKQRILPYKKKKPATYSP